MIGTLAVDGWVVPSLGCGPAHRLLAVPNVTARPSTATDFILFNVAL